MSDLKPGGERERMHEHGLEWRGYMTEQTREKILAGRVPNLVYDLERPSLKEGDHVVLEWGESHDPGMGAKFRYPRRWIVIRSIAPLKGSRWIVTYSPPEKMGAYMRRGGGTTVDRLRSIDREVEYEDYKPTPLNRATNTIIHERRRIEAELAGHVRRMATTKNERTRARLPNMILSCREKLAELEAHDQEAA